MSNDEAEVNAIYLGQSFGQGLGRCIAASGRERDAKRLVTLRVARSALI